MKRKKKSLLDDEDFMVSPLNDEDLVVYELDYAGKRIKLDIKPEELQNYLNPERVLIIIRKNLHKIYIWRGSKSPVRKRFNSSRVAFDIRRDLNQKGRDYKIISIDQKVHLFKDRLKGGGWTEGEYGDLKHGKDVLF